VARKPTLIAAAFAVALVSTGCHQRGIIPATPDRPAVQPSTDAVDQSQTKSDQKHHLNSPAPSKKPTLLSAIPVLNKVSDLPSELNKIPLIRDIKSAPKVIEEIPIINQVARYFKTRPSKSFRRIKGGFRDHSEANRDKTKPTHFDENDQHFSGGLDYDETVYLKNIKVTKAESNTLIKLNTTNICRYSIDYIDQKQRIEILLKGCKNRLKKMMPKIAQDTIIQKSEIKSIDESTTVIIFDLKQHARLNVIEAYAPTYILIDVTPMYPLFAAPVR
jgi:hypothetical protein